MLHLRGVACCGVTCVVMSRCHLRGVISLLLLLHLRGVALCVVTCVVMTAVGTCAVSAFLADASPAGCRMLWRHLRGDVKVSPARCHLSVASASPAWCRIMCCHLRGDDCSWHLRGVSFLGRCFTCVVLLFLTSSAW